MLLSHKYPQLRLPIEAGIRNTDEYRNAVLRGIFPQVEPSFTYNEKDTLTPYITPAGSVDILFLENRDDFVHAVQALACRCEPDEVPPSMGATSISGLINWQKIHEHLRQYAENGGQDQEGEFSKFTADKTNYLDSLIILSSGDYSAVPASEVNLEAVLWKEKSVTIRKFHELTHFYCRKRYPENKEALRDEIIADMIGLKAAFGYYDPHTASLFMGIEGDSYRKGGRLENYIHGKDPVPYMQRAKKLIDLFSNIPETEKKGDLFCLIDYIEKNKIGTFQT